ncbi:MAG TPA: TIGR03067 domain-containing protein, partial [Kofleriaceae bacterium]|nr:TIGR03067 domain-containing protein [Kofleriaceae bacterium]
AAPPHIDIEFVSGPDAGETCQGIYAADGDQLTLCLGVVGASRPQAFATRAGSGHALERLHRASKARPAGVTGGTPPPPVPAVAVDRADPAAIDQPMTPLLRRLQGEWAAVELVINGKAPPAQWLAHGSRTMDGNQVKVVFGGQTVVHAAVRIDESARPIAVDYVDLRAKHRGIVSHGILEWIGDQARFLMAPPGAARPSAFTDAPATGTLSRWRRR